MCPTLKWHLKMTSGNPNPWAPPAFASPTAPACQFLMLRILLLTILLMSPLKANCRPADCKSIRFEFPKSIANTLKRSQNNFGLCFLHDQTKIVCHKWSGIFGGCPYASCDMHKAPKSEMLVIDNQGNTILQNEAILTNQLRPPSSNSQPFSWLALVQQGINMLSLTEAINFTNCFLCASLNEPPLAAVPLQTGFNLSQSPMGPDTTLTGIPLFKAHSQNLSLCYGTTDNPSCNTTVKVLPGGYFWCNRTLTKVINASLPLLCVPVTLVPQLKVYGQAEFQSLLTPPAPSVRRNKRAIFLPVVVGLSLASSLVAAGIGSGAMGYSVTSAAQLEDKLRVATEASAASLASLQ
ncbi:provirus ancestral Env polyprotein [Plecturocebus cupreus]